MLIAQVSTFVLKDAGQHETQEVLDGSVHQGGGDLPDLFLDGLLQQLESFWLSVTAFCPLKWPQSLKSGSDRSGE